MFNKLLQLRDAQLQAELKDDKVLDLKQQLDVARDLDMRQSNEIQQLRRQLTEFDSTTRAFSSVTASTSKLEHRDLYERIKELESRLR